MFDINHLQLQKLDKKGLNTLIDWAEREGWNPGKCDSEAFWKADPNGFYGFYFEDKLIAGGAIVSYNGDFGFMGLFIVHPDFRGYGIGNKLWYLRRDLLLRRLKEGATIGMDGVVDMQPFYEKGGFEIAFRDERYECIGKDVVISEHISDIQDDDFEEILAYDLHCFGFRRTEFLKYWIKMPNSQSFKYAAGEKLRGFAVIREVASGFKIGPLFADNEQIAEELYKTCLKNAVGHPVYMDMPTTNEKAINLLKKYDAKYVFECARMYYGKRPQVDIDKVYGITTFELG